MRGVVYQHNVEAPNVAELSPLCYSDATSNMQEALAKVFPRPQTYINEIVVGEGYQTSQGKLSAGRYLPLYLGIGLCHRVSIAKRI